jgi:hypothetical protein
LRFFAAIKPKALNRVAKISYGRRTLVLLIITLFRNCVVIEHVEATFPHA